MAAIPNVVVFGGTGAGKSSLINMIAGNSDAPISSRSVGCTLQSKCYTVDIDGMRVNLHDTAGLNEGQGGAVDKQDAIINLYTLLRKLDTGVSLLVFCMRGPRITESCTNNWQLFREIICQRRVPILLAVTGLENEEPSMDNWWTQNERYFDGHKMYPDGVACVTAIRGKPTPDGGYKFGTEYRESQVKIRRSIHELHLHPPWRVPQAEWFAVIAETSYKENGKSVEEIKTYRTVLGSATRELINRRLMTEEEAKELAQRMNGI